MEFEGVVTRKCQATIPVKLCKKFRIEEGTRLEVIEAAEGFLFKPRKSFWDLIGSGAESATVEEVKEELDKLREEDI